MIETAVENSGEEDEEDEEECGYFYQPVHLQMPIADQNIEQADTQVDGDQETPVLSTDGPVVEERLLTQNTSEPETQLENVLQEEDNQNEDEQPVEDSLDEIPISPDSGEAKEQGHDLPRRERRAPKIFAYDQLGTPACYSTA